MRIHTIFKSDNKTPSWVLYNIIKYWLNDELNETKISTKLKEKYNLENISILFIYKFLQNYRIIIANYIRSIFQLDPLSYKDAHQIIVVDETLFNYLTGQPIWIIGLINFTSNEIRMEIENNRARETLKKI